MGDMNESDARWDLKQNKKGAASCVLLTLNHTNKYLVHTTMPKARSRRGNGKRNGGDGGGTAPKVRDENEERESGAVARKKPGREAIYDYAKCVALVLMITHHIFYMPNITVRPRPTLPNWVDWCGWFARYTFLTLIGLNLALTFRREVELAGKPPGTFLRRRLERGALIYCAGVIIQLTTFTFQGPENEIRFGVLHSIGALVSIASLCLYLFPSRLAFLPFCAIVGSACQWMWYNRWNWRYMWWKPMAWCHENSPWFLSQILYALGSPDPTDKSRRAPDYFPLLKW